MANVSFKTLDKVAGPLIFVKGVDNAAYGEMVEIKLPDGERRQGQVLDTSQGLAVVQVFGQTLGLSFRYQSGISCRPSFWTNTWSEYYWHHHKISRRNCHISSF